MMTSKTHRAIALGAAWVGVVLLNMIFLPWHYAPHVQVEHLKIAPMPLIVRASGHLEAKDSNTIKAQFDGPVVSKNFREGQQVQKGQLLAVIGTERIKLDYQTKQDALRNAQDDLGRARKDLKVQKELFNQQAVAYSSVEDAERAVVKATQGLRNAKEAFQLAQSQMDSGKVIAPISGTIVKDWLGDDKLISNGKEIITVADVSEYTVKTSVDELDVRQIREGQQAEVRLPVYDETPLKAVVSQVGSQTEGNGVPEVPVILKLQVPSGMLLRPKLTAEARIITGGTDPVLSIPLTALSNADGHTRVWVVGTFHRIHARPIDIGRSNPYRAEVVRGLSVGDAVCMTAGSNFAEGMKVIEGPSWAK